MIWFSCSLWGRTWSVFHVVLTKERISMQQNAGTQRAGHCSDLMFLCFWFINLVQMHLLLSAKSYSLPVFYLHCQRHKNSWLAKMHTVCAGWGRMRVTKPSQPHLNMGMLLHPIAATKSIELNFKIAFWQNSGQKVVLIMGRTRNHDSNS